MNFNGLVCRIVLFNLALCALLRPLTIDAAPRQQIVVAPAGEEVDGTKQTVRAYCLEHNVSGFPTASMSLPHVTGRVRVEFLDPKRPPAEMNTEDAVKAKLVLFFGADPTDTYSATVK